VTAIGAFHAPSGANGMFTEICRPTGAVIETGIDCAVLSSGAPAALLEVENPDPVDGEAATTPAHRDGPAPTVTDAAQATVLCG